ncbi:MAG: hypothetical protein M3069_03710 [Chloroflexota bacterium]|nr:hypothetical protein [Chloroflexota bacterium]
MAPLIYLLEDDPNLRELLAEVVREELTPELEPCARMSDLQAHCATRRPDLIVADFWGKSHVNLAEAERLEISALAAIAPLVLVSARVWALTANPTELGIAAVLTKPLELERFIDVLRSALAATSAVGSA